MKADGLWSNIFRTRRKDTIAEVLHYVPLFQELSPQELKILENLVHIRAYKAGEAVFAEAQPAAGMYVIRSGRVDILANHREPNSLILSEMEAGDFFGEMALLGETIRSATAMVREDAELIGFFHPELIEIINLHPAMGAKISLGLARTLAERLRYTTLQLREMCQIRGVQ
jgi:CRP/FNR family cyclic AMP-dependent transcriptional regulator